MKAAKKTGVKRGESYSIREGRLLLGSRSLDVPPLLVAFSVASCDRDPFRDRVGLPEPVVGRILRINTYVRAALLAGKPGRRVVEEGGRHD